MTRSPRNRIIRNAATILNTRGFVMVWSASLNEWHSDETIIGMHGAKETLHVKLKCSPNTLTDKKEITQFCDSEIRTLRRLMSNNPNQTGKQYEVWVLMPFKKYSVIEVLPDRLIDWRSDNVLSPLAARGVLG
jgi:hypothetical protein